jgi:hypothetical protein
VTVDCVLGASPVDDVLGATPEEAAVRRAPDERQGRWRDILGAMPEDTAVRRALDERQGRCHGVLGPAPDDDILRAARHIDFLRAAPDDNDPRGAAAVVVVVGNLFFIATFVYQSFFSALQFCAKGMGSVPPSLTGRRRGGRGAMPASRRKGSAVISSPASDATTKEHWDRQEGGHLL